MRRAWLSALAAMIMSLCTVGSASADETLDRANGEFYRERPDRTMAILTPAFIRAMREATPESHARASQYLDGMYMVFAADDNDEAALPLARLAFKLDRTNYRAAGHIVESLTRGAHYKLAKQQIDDLASDTGAQADAAFVRSRASYLAATGLTEQAKATYRESIKLNPNEFRTHVSLAKLLTGEEAAKEYEQAGRCNKSAYFGELCFWQADFARKGKQATTTHLDAAARMRPSDAAWKIFSFWRLSSLGQAEEAMTIMTKAVDENPLQMRASQQLALSAMYNNRPKLARSCIEHIMRIRPGRPAEHWQLGLLAESQKNDGLAEREYLKALMINPEYRNAYSSLMTLAAYQGNEARRADLAKRWVENCPTDSEAIFAYVRCLYDAKKYSEASAVLDKVAAPVAKKWEATQHGWSALLAYRRNDHRTADAEVREFDRTRAVTENVPIKATQERIDFNTLKPGSTEEQAAFHGAMGCLLDTFGEDDDAIAEYKKALDLHNDINWHRGLLTAYIHKQDIRNAMAEDIVVSRNVVATDIPKSVEKYGRQLFRF